MSEYERYRRERDWADGAAEKNREEGGGETYRDGSLKNECWNSSGYTRTGKTAPNKTKQTEKKP